MSTQQTAGEVLAWGDVGDGGGGPEPWRLFLTDAREAAAGDGPRIGVLAVLAVRREPAG